MTNEFVSITRTYMRRCFRCTRRGNSTDDGKQHERRCEFIVHNNTVTRKYSRPEAQFVEQVNPLESRGNYSATSNNMKLVHWPLMGGLLHFVQRGEDWAGSSPSRRLLVVPNVTAHPSTASVPITVLLYNSTLLCSFNVCIKGLSFVF